jgi:hypothetical protein
MQSSTEVPSSAEAINLERPLRWCSANAHPRSGAAAGIRASVHIAARSLPARDAAVHRDGGGEPADDHQHGEAEPVARRGARWSVAQQSEQVLARQMHYTNGAPGPGRGRDFEDSAREQSLQRPARWWKRRNSRPGARRTDTLVAGRGDGGRVDNAIRDGKLGAVTGALLQRQERLDDEITAQAADWSKCSRPA